MRPVALPRRHTVRTHVVIEIEDSRVNLGLTLGQQVIQSLLSTRTRAIRRHIRTTLSQRRPTEPDDTHAREDKSSSDEKPTRGNGLRRHDSSSSRKVRNTSASDT